MNTDYQILQINKNFIEVDLLGKKTHIDKGYLHWALGEVLGWQRGNSNFTALLMGLIAKADGENKKKLALGFPTEVFAYFLWFYKEGLVNYEKSEDFIEKVREWLKDSKENA